MATLMDSRDLGVDNLQARRLDRRDFIKWIGVGAAAAFAPPGRAFAGIWGGDDRAPVDLKSLAQTHDLPSLPDWGPYSKKYFGISHIPDARRGLCFDWSLFPVLTGGTVQLPSVIDPCGVHPWEAAPGLDFYSLRFELMGRDRIYCDLSYSQVSEDRRLARLELVNQTGAAREVTLHCLTQLVFPPLKELTAEPIRLCAVELPPGTTWVHALDYAELQFALPRPTDHLVPDGKYRGEERCHDSVEGSVVAENFGREAGDTVVYRVRLGQRLADAVLVWRFRAEAGQSVAFQLDGPVSRRLVFRGTGEFDTVTVPVGRLDRDEREWRFISTGGAPVTLDGFALIERAVADRLRFVATPWHPVPEIEKAGTGLVLKYEDVPDSYGFVLGTALAGQRQLKWRDADAAFGTEPGANTRNRIYGDRRRGRAGDPDSLLIHAFSRPLTVGANSRVIIHNLVCTGSAAHVRRALNAFDPQSAGNEEAYSSARAKAFHPVATPAGEGFRFSQQLMSAVTLTNLVYPVYVQRNHVRHYSPGRNWDCLYTWDAGFIGLGLAEIDLGAAAEILNAYLTAPGAQSAFIHHGSPVPVQVYLFQELWNRTQSHPLLEYFYPRVRQYHRFLTGHWGGSTTRRHRDRLVCTWDYFYNSGGWDDYPPQKHVHQQKLEARVTPVINSAHAIRCARILRLAAAALGRTEDFAEYDEDIACLSASLQAGSWDAASGYFGYVVHDDRGEATGILRDETGANFNQGLDGVYPLIAGFCGPEQEEQMLQRLFSPEHLWMDIGITTVDRSAPYYSPDGYWNGSVWFAHQWFFWKTMLDLGRGDLAGRIARTGLKIWKTVTDETHDCMEHFKPAAPFGAGWHQFSSLSSPVLSWFASLYTPGRLTCGFDAWVEDCRFSRDQRQLRARLGSSGRPGGKCCVLACLCPGSDYQVLWNGKPAEFTMVEDGLLEIRLPRGGAPGELSIN